MISTQAYIGYSSESTRFTLSRTYHAILRRGRRAERWRGCNTEELQKEIGQEYQYDVQVHQTSRKPQTTESHYYTTFYLNPNLQQYNNYSLIHFNKLTLRPFARTTRFALALGLTRLNEGNKVVGGAAVLEATDDGVEEPCPVSAGAPLN